jgi:hypothetical protein
MMNKAFKKALSRRIAMNPTESPSSFVESMVKLRNEKGIDAVIDAKKKLGRFRGEHLSTWNDSDIGKEAARAANTKSVAGHRKKNPEHTKELAKKRYSENAEKMRSYQKDYRDANKEKISQQRRLNRIRRLKDVSGGGSGSGMKGGPMNIPTPKLKKD